MRRRVVLAVVVLVGVVGVVVWRWGATPRGVVGDEGIRSITTDGEAVYVASRPPDSGSGRRSMIRKFDADGDVVWAVAHQVPRRPLRAWGDGVLWSTNDRPDDWLSDRNVGYAELEKIDARTGVPVAVVDLGENPQGPFVHKGSLWVVEGFDLAATVLDPETLDVVDIVDLRVGGTADPPYRDRGPLIHHPYVVGDTLYYILNSSFLGDTNWFVEFSLVERHVTRETRLDLEIWDTDLVEEQLWISLRDRDEYWLGPTEWRVVSVDLVSHEVGQPMPFLGSPFDSVVTDDYVFDLVDRTETVQIDRATGEVVRRFDDLPLPEEDHHTVTPEFVLNDHLWFSDLSRRKIATPD